MAGIILNADFIEADRFDIYSKPVPGDLLNVDALKVNGVTEDDLKSDKYLGPITAKKVFEGVLSKYVNKFDKKDKLTFVGYNAFFDADFIRAWFVKMGDKFFGSWFWWPPIDVMVLAADVVGEKRPNLENFKLATVATHFGIELDQSKLHEALYDIEVTLQLYKHLNGFKI